MPRPPPTPVPSAGHIVLCAATGRARDTSFAIVHAGALKPWGGTLPWAWPHDGLAHDRTSGEPLAEGYRRHGLNLLAGKAEFADGSAGVEAGLFMMLERMQTGRLKVFRHFSDWFEEFRLYHGDAGKVVKLRDDPISATRSCACASPSRRARRASRTSWTIRRWGLCDRECTVSEAAEDESMPIVAFLALASTVPQIRKALHDTLVRSRRKLTLLPQSGRRF